MVKMMNTSVSVRRILQIVRTRLPLYTHDLVRKRHTIKLQNGNDHQF